MTKTYKRVCQLRMAKSAIDQITSSDDILMIIQLSYYPYPAHPESHYGKSYRQDDHPDRSAQKGNFRGHLYAARPHVVASHSQTDASVHHRSRRLARTARMVGRARRQGRKPIEVNVNKNGQTAVLQYRGAKCRCSKPWTPHFERVANRRHRRPAAVAHHYPYSVRARLRTCLQASSKIPALARQTRV